MSVSTERVPEAWRAEIELWPDSSSMCCNRGVFSVKGARVVAVPDLTTEGRELMLAGFATPRAPPLALTFLKHSDPQTSLKPWHGPSPSQFAFVREVSVEIPVVRRCLRDGLRSGAEGALEISSWWSLGLMLDPLTCPAVVPECERLLEAGCFVFGPRGVWPGSEFVRDLPGLFATLGAWL